MADEKEGTEGGKGNIMLVDDDKFLIDMYSLKFRGAGYTVQAHLRAKDALDALRGGFAAHAIVFDILMPETEGFSFLETIKTEKLAKDAVLVALTNQANDFEKKRAEELGCDRYIVKASMIPSEVVHAVEEEIQKKK
ncbi:response regulator [Candidatus Parcubacteria bacterium]|nr:MAG: response regulator [Candidatus Parcubacteria bacterium]